MPRHRPARSGNRRARRAATGLLAAALLVTGGLSACGGGGPRSQADGGPPTIALLLPETHITRYEARDRPLFVEAVRERCPTCQVLTSNAQGDAGRQHAQAEAALANGADVLVVDPVDAYSARAIVTRAESAGAAVVAYDEIIAEADIDAFIRFADEEVGRIQARALLDALAAAGKPDGTIVVLNGPAEAPIAATFKRGAYEVFDASAVRIGADFDVVNWIPAKAQEQMEQAIARLGPQGIDGVHAVGDAVAAAALAAFEGAGVRPPPPITGQDAELAAIQRILAGEQLMTVFRDIEAETAVAADIAVALARDEEPPAAVFNATVDNGATQVPAVVLEPIPVFRDTIADTVVAKGLYTVDQICTPAFARACEAAGLR